VREAQLRRQVEAEEEEATEGQQQTRYAPRRHDALQAPHFTLATEQDALEVPACFVCLLEARLLVWF